MLCKILFVTIGAVIMTASAQTCDELSPTDGSDDSCIAQGLDLSLACCCAADGCASCTDCEIMMSSSAPPPDCDVTDESQWSIVPVGKSTQFKIFDACDDNSFVKIKMDGLTEIDADGKKTNNKETSFASTKGWTFGTGEGIDLSDCDGNGNGCVFNRFKADALKSTGASFMLDTFLAVDPLNVTVPGDNNTNETLTVAVGSVKFDVEIGGWPFESEENTLELCIDVQTNKAGSVNNEDDGRAFRLGSVEIENVKTAQCDNETIDVSITLDSNDNNKFEVCYEFDYCAGLLQYDPIISLSPDSDSKSSSIFIVNAVLVACMISLFV